MFLLMKSKTWKSLMIAYFFLTLSLLPGYLLIGTQHMQHSRIDANMRNSVRHKLWACLYVHLSKISISVAATRNQQKQDRQSSASQP